MRTKIFPVIDFVIASRGGNVLGSFNVKLLEPRLNYLSLRINNSGHVLLGPEDSVTFSANDNIRVEEIDTNLYNNSEINLSINGKKLTNGDAEEIRDLCTSRHNEIKVHNGSILIGKVYIDMAGD